LDRSDIGDQILERYQEWKKTLQPASLIERIKYQTSQDQWGSRSGLSIKESNQKLNEQFMELATESIATPEILVGLKDWVGNSLDKNSRMLAFHLGQFDERGVFEEEFLSWVDDTEKLDFVLTYLNCRSHHFPDSRVEMQKHLDSLSKDNPQVSIQATIKADVSEVGFERITSVLPKLDSLKQIPLLDLGFGAWDELLEPRKKAELLTAIIRHPSPDGFPTALKLAAFILESENEEESQSKEFRDVIEEVLVASMETEARFEVHDLIDPVEFIADSNVQLAAEVVCQQVFGTFSNIIASNALSQSFNWLVERDQTTAFQAVGPHLLAEDTLQRFGISVYREFFDKFDKETVEAWTG
jgi:hypothetical protein